MRFLDAYNFPNAEIRPHRTVIRGSASSTWLAWRKPEGPTMASIFIMGGGGGGGGGTTGAAASARGGGGGGGTGSASTLIVRLDLIPDTIYFLCGSGGGGGAAGSAGTSGDGSFVSLTQSSAVAGNILANGAGGSGGGGGTSAAAGAVGAAGTTPSAATMVAGFQLGLVQVIAGNPGIIGGAPAGANGGNIGLPWTGGCPASGGGGGAGTTSADFAGSGFGGVVAGNYFSERAPSTPAAGSNNGSSGYQIWNEQGTGLFAFFGGCGGSASNAGVGGFGGNGAFGCGGGGGGGGTTGGTGGRGGHGFAIISCW